MATVIVRHAVVDVDEWRAVFDGAVEARDAAGAKNAVVFQDAGSPQMITAVFDWDSVENARSYLTSAAVAEAMEAAGVVGTPSVMYLEQV